MITQNFRLNALANQYAAALYDYVTTSNSGEHFMIDAGGEAIRVEILGGIKGMRNLVDGFALEALKESYRAAQWEGICIAVLSRCVNRDGLTDMGRSTWESMVSDMGSTVAGDSHA